MSAATPIHACQHANLVATRLSKYSKSLALAHASPGPTLELLGVLSELYGRLEVGWALVVRTAEHAYDGEKDRRRRLHGRPAFRRGFVACVIVYRRMQDGYADVAVLVDCGSGVSKGRQNVRGHTVRVP
jgi:hypothetical protein